jgi:hypothetical protein
MPARLIRRRRKIDLDLTRPRNSRVHDAELVEVIAASIVIALFPDGSREIIIHREGNGAPAKLVAFRDREQARVFAHSSNAYVAAGSQAALMLWDIQANFA